MIAYMDQIYNTFFWKNLLIPEVKNLLIINMNNINVYFLLNLNSWVFIVLDNKYLKGALIYLAVIINKILYKKIYIKK